MCASMVASNLATPVSLARPTASLGSYSWSGLILAAASRERLPLCIWEPPGGACGALASPSHRTALTGRLLDFYTHRAGGALDHPHGSLFLGRVEVSHLELGDMADLGLGDRADLFAVGHAGTLLHPRGLLEKVAGGRSLDDEREATVFEDRDLRGGDLAGHRLGLLVVGLDEVHDVDAVGAQRGAHRRRRGGVAGGELDLDDGADFLLAHSLLLVQPLDLEQVELDRRLATEHVDQDLELALVGHDLVDLAVEVAERSVDAPDVLADLILDLDLGRLGLGLLDDGLDLVGLERDRLVAAAHERGHAGGVADDVPRLVGHLHVDQDVAREDALLDVAALAVLDLDDFLGRNQEVKDLVVHVHRLDALEEVVANLVLMPGIGMDHVPLSLGCLAHYPCP